MIRETKITISVTPKLLRRIADEMEERMEHCKLGENVPSHSFYDNNHGWLEVKLSADQDAYHRHGQSSWI